jgi:hypothetical protein
MRNPGALGRVLARLLAIGLPLAALGLFLLTRSDPPETPSASSPSVPTLSVPSIHARLTGTDAGFPSADLPSVGVPDVRGPNIPSIDLGGGGTDRGVEAAREQVEDSGPRIVRERVHEHDYHIYIFWFWPLLLIVLLALGLLLLVPINVYTAAVAAAGCGVALWLGIEFVYAGTYPEVFDSRNSYVKDGVRHIVTTYRHLHPVNVKGPLILLALGLASWSGHGLWRLWRRPRRLSIPSLLRTRRRRERG